MAVVADDRQWDHRGNFLMAAAEAMRRILVNRALQKRAIKHGGDRKRVELQEADLVVSVPAEELLDLNDALSRLAEESPKEADLVKLRYFAGLSLEEAAQALSVSSVTA